jgi:hypothetical protein
MVALADKVEIARQRCRRAAAGYAGRRLVGGRASPSNATMGEDVLSAFADYERELTSLLSSAQHALSTAGSAGTPVGEAASSLDAADRDTSEAADVLQSMSLEVSALSPAARARAAPRLDACRTEAAAARTALRAARIALAKRRGEDERGALFAGLDGDGDLEAGRADGATRKLEEGGERILESRRNVARTEGVAASILSDLASQRATIVRARGNLGGVDEGLDQSSAVLSSMNRRAMVNKLVMYAIFAVIALICLSILYSRLFGQS